QGAAGRTAAQSSHLALMQLVEIRAKTTEFSCFSLNYTFQKSPREARMMETHTGVSRAREGEGRIRTSAYLRGNCWSNAKFSFNTLTRGSPSIPKAGPSVY